jgi:hypothetical protein
MPGSHGESPGDLGVIAVSRSLAQTTREINCTEAP